MKETSRAIRAPESVSEISVDWLKQILRDQPASDDIISIELDRSFGPISLLGKAVRVKIGYADERGEPKSVIVKFQVSVDKPKREGQIYHLLSEAGIKYTPKVYGTFGNGHLVLEDLSPTHSVVKNSEDLTMNQAHNVVAKLADINSRFWGDARVPREDLSLFINVINFNMRESWEIFKNRYKAELKEEESAAFEWMWQNAKTVGEFYNSGPGALVHGDVNQGNLLFPNNGSDEPVFIDWQLSARMVPAFDLSYFLVQKLSVEQRREHEGELLKEYYRLLPGHVQANYTFDHLQLDYRACVTRSMMSAVTYVGPKFSNFPDQFERSDTLATRIIAAIKDLKPIEAIRELQERGWLK